MIRHHQKECGVGLVEVLMALAVLMFAALSISTLQTETHISMRISETHFSVIEQTQDMLEVLRTNSGKARDGAYNTGYAESVIPGADSSGGVESMIQKWKERVNSVLPEGAGMIECDSDKCTVSVRWLENIDGSVELQRVRIAGPI